MEEINLGIFVILILMIALYHHPRETIKIVMFPLIGFMVLMDVIVSLIKYVLGIGR